MDLTLCFTFRDFQDGKLSIKDMEKYDRKLLTGLSYWKLDEPGEPHVVGTVFERQVNFNDVRDTARKQSAKEHQIKNEKWIAEPFN